MTKKKLILSIMVCAIFYILVFLSGISFYFMGKSEDLRYYGMFKDLFLIIAAILLAYLSLSFQHRFNFHVALSLLWTNMIHAANKAILFTAHRVEAEKEYMEMVLLINKSIDTFLAGFDRSELTFTDKKCICILFT